MPCLLLVLVYPLLVPLENLIFRYTEISIGMQLIYIFIYAILALGLNVVVGYTGLLHLGIAAFFGIGAYHHRHPHRGRLSVPDRLCAGDAPDRWRGRCADWCSERHPAAAR